MDAYLPKDAQVPYPLGVEEKEAENEEEDPP
jgi:hypothetical protein